MIIAIKENERVVFGYTNRQAMTNLSLKDYIDDENVPMGFFENGCAFSFVTMNRQSDLFRYDEEFLKMEPTSKTIVREMLPYIKKKLRYVGAITDEGVWKNALVISDGEHIYGIDRELNFYEVDDYTTHSFTTDQITSCLDATEDWPAEKRIIAAVSFVEELRGEKLFPLIIMDTKDKEKKYAYGGESSEHSLSL